MLAIELDVDFFQLSISTPYPGTQLFKQAMEEGRIAHCNFKLYGQSDPLVRLDDLTVLAEVPKGTFDME